MHLPPVTVRVVRELQFRPRLDRGSQDLELVAFDCFEKGLHHEVVRAREDEEERGERILVTARSLPHGLTPAWWAAPDAEAVGDCVSGAPVTRTPTAKGKIESLGVRARTVVTDNRREGRVPVEAMVLGRLGVRLIVVSWVMVSPHVSQLNVGSSGMARSLLRIGPSSSRAADQTRC
jgi:hypothetical protein